MSEKPILFSGPMVRAIIAGTKTQTRRVIVPHRSDGAFVLLEQDDGSFWPYRSDDGEWASVDNMEIPLRSRYSVGDVLWVRETWANLAYDCNEPMITFKAGTPSTDTEGWALPPGVKWRPGMFLRRAHARLFLRVTSVRVERLQDMEGAHPSESDALAEGINAIHHGDGAYYYHYERTEPHGKNWCDPTDAFRELWDSLNAKRGFGWETNCWVWVIEFERLNAARDEGKG